MFDKGCSKKLHLNTSILKDSDLLKGFTCLSCQIFSNVIWWEMAIFGSFFRSMLKLCSTLHEVA